ncbi:MAG TPA: MCP four helix bundle domain-containing protein, partial [Burkholderiaceae bacterium]|nr:MCP four helix bundle domain-containing protein [Burkholderiaceae bacterium]
MKNWSIRNRIIASFAVLLLLMLAMGLIAHTRLSEIEAETALADSDSIAGLHASATMRGMWSIDNLMTLKYLQEPNPETRRQLLQDLQASRRQHGAKLEEYAKTITTAQDRELYEALKAANIRVQRFEDELLTLVENKQRPEALALFHGELARAMEALQPRLQALIDLNKDNAHRSMVDIRDHVAYTNKGMIVALALSAFAAVLSGWLLLRAISEPMQRVLAVLDT